MKVRVYAPGGALLAEATLRDWRAVGGPRENLAPADRVVVAFLSEDGREKTLLLEGRLEPISL